MKKTTIGVVIAGTLILTALLAVAIRTDRINLSGWFGDRPPVIFSTDRMLLELWNTYKTGILEPESLRALDRSQGNITTSEGQSYTMMRAAWMDDIATFDTAWQWTKDNMQRDDKLISWKFGELKNGTYGIQADVGGNNTATDGDTDIALSLLMAASRWKEPLYLYDAQDMLKSIWEKEVVIINGKPVLVANDIERLDKKSVIVNPSYFAPYAYKEFAKVDPERDWEALADNSYDIVFAASDSTLDKEKTAGLTPNWIRIDRTTGEVKPAPELDSNYGYDAFRTPWRLALDWKWNEDVRAKQVLAKYSVLADEWRANNSLNAVYGHDGTVISNDKVPAAYGANIGYFMVTEPELAKEIYETRLLTLYSADTQSWNRPLGYYDDNWAWFGMALYENNLPNLVEQYE